MTIGLVGRKAGMTRVFTDDGVSVPVTVIEVEPKPVAVYGSFAWQMAKKFRLEIS